MKKNTIVMMLALGLLIAGATVYAQMPGMGKANCLAPGMQQNCPMGMGDGSGSMMRGHGKHGGGMRGSKGGDRLGMLLSVADEIGLSEEQISRLKTMQIEFRKQMIDDRATLKKAKLDLRALKFDDAESGEVVKAIEQVGDLKTDLAKKRYLHREEVRMVLTADQLEKLEELREQRREQGFQNGGNGQGRGKGQGQGRGRGLGMAPSDVDDWDLSRLDDNEL